MSEGGDEYKVHPVVAGLAEVCRRIIDCWLDGGGQLPTEIVPQVEFQGTAKQIKAKSLPQYNAPLVAHNARLPQLPEATAYYDLVALHPHLCPARSAPNSSPSIHTVIQGFIDAFSKAQRDHSTPLPTDAQVARVLDRLAREIHANTLPWRLLAPLANVSVRNLITGPFTDGLTLRVLTNEDRAYLYRLTTFPGLVELFGTLGMSDSDVEEAELALEYIFEHHGQPDPSALLNPVGRALTALRLATTGGIGTPGALILHESALGLVRLLNAPVDGGFGMPWLGNSALDPGTIDRAYQISQAISRLTSSQDKVLAVALRRFNQAYERHNLDDVVLDLGTAFGSMLSDGDKHDITFKITAWTAVLLADQRASSHVFRQMSDLWFARNQIAHRGKSLYELCSSPRMTRWTEGEDSPPAMAALWLGLLRETLLHIIDLFASGHTIESIRNDLNERLASKLDR